MAMFDYLPTHSKVENQLVVYLDKFHAPLEARQVYDPLAEAMRLTGEQRMREIETAAGRENGWECWVRNARRRLVDQRLMEEVQNIGRDQWALTKAGHERASRLLEQMEFRRKAKDGSIKLDDIL